MLDLTTGSSAQLTFNTWPAGVSSGPIFSPDGTSIVYGVYDEEEKLSEVRMVSDASGRQRAVGARRIAAALAEWLALVLQLREGWEYLRGKRRRNRRKVVRGPEGRGPWSLGGTRVVVWGIPLVQGVVWDAATYDVTKRDQR